MKYCVLIPAHDVLTRQLKFCEIRDETVCFATKYDAESDSYKCEYDTKEERDGAFHAFRDTFKNARCKDEMG